VRLRRLALAPAALVVAGLATAGCAQQSAAVRVNDQTVSRTELYEELDVIATNTEFQQVVLSEDADPSLIPGKLGGSYAQPFVGEVIRQRIIGMLANEALATRGIEVSDAERKAVDDQLAEAMQGQHGDIASLPQRYRDDFVASVAAATRLNQELGQDRANQALREANDAADISVSSEFGSWDGDNFTVVPPPGAASAGGSGGSGSSSG
jgi:hypothetical protein